MKRYIIESLKKWRDNTRRKPLLLLGARQVGKTWILNYFANEYYADFHYFDFSENKDKFNAIFSSTSDPVSIIKELEIFQERKINITDDLIIFDEIQAEPLALKSLKSFNQNLSGIHLACAGSLLGVSLIDESFPVGMVTYLDMFPLSFEEFLEARADEIITKGFRDSILEEKTSVSLHEKLFSFLKEYLITGGMPEAVQSYLANLSKPVEGFFAARNIQKSLLRDYLNDFSKHAGKLNAYHIQQVFESIPLQLANTIDASTKRYLFKNVIPGKKGYGPLEGPINWLEYAGLVYKVPIINKAELPLKAFSKTNIFKLQVFDIGLLGAMLELPAKTIIENNYGSTKGYFMEAFVLGELRKSLDSSILSWTERNSELEFISIINDTIIPIEVKASHRTKAKSLAQFLIKYNPDIAVKFLDKGLRPKSDHPVWHIPLYYAGKLKMLLEKYIR